MVTKAELDELQAEKARAEAAKTAAETEILRQQLSPTFRLREDLKMFLSASGLVLAIASLIGAGFTVYKGFEEQRLSRETKTQERIDKSLGDLHAASSQQRAAAVAILRSATVNDFKVARAIQALDSLAEALSVEDDRFVRELIVSFFEEFDYSKLPKETVDRIFKSVLSYDRVLTLSSSVLTRQTDDQVNSNLGDIAKMMALARVAGTMARNGAYASDMSNLYLADTSFKGAFLPFARFDNSILEYADFSEAVLAKATFQNNMLDGATFVSANLRGATMDLSPKQPSFFFARRPVRSRWMLASGNERDDDALEVELSDPKASYRPPSFRCADLREARIKGLPIASYARTAGSASASYGSFVRARIEGAQIRPSIVVRTDDIDDALKDLHASSRGYKVGDKQWVYQVTVSDAWVPKPVEEDFLVMPRPLQQQRDFEMFAETNWKAADLPKWLVAGIQLPHDPDEFRPRTARQMTCKPPRSMPDGPAAPDRQPSPMVRDWRLAIPD